MEEGRRAGGASSGRWRRGTAGVAVRWRAGGAARAASSGRWKRAEEEGLGAVEAGWRGGTAELGLLRAVEEEGLGAVEGGKAELGLLRARWRSTAELGLLGARRPRGATGRRRNEVAGRRGGAALRRGGEVRLRARPLLLLRKVCDLGKERTTRAVIQDLWSRFMVRTGTKGSLVPVRAMNRDQMVAPN